MIRLIKSVFGKAIFREFPEIKEELWGGEFWTDGYYIATVSGRGSKKVIENYIKSQGREQDIKQLLFLSIKRLPASRNFNNISEADGASSHDKSSDIS